MTFIDTQFIRETEGNIENKRKRYVIYKYLPFVTKRRIIRKPFGDGIDSNDVSGGSENEQEPMSFVALQILFEPASINNKTVHTRYTLTCDTTSSAYTYQLPLIPIESGAEVSNYKKMIREYLLSEFGIVQKYISKIQYINQHIHDDIYCINLYQVHLSTCHRYFPVRPFENYKDPYRIENDPMTDIVVCTEDKRAKFHKYQWHWKVVMHTLNCTEKVKEHFENVMMDKHKNADEKWEEYIRGIPSVQEEIKHKKYKAFVNIDNEIKVQLPI
jgi:hypothetical protein